MYSELCGEYTVNYAGSKAGTLKISQKGLMTVFDCLCTCNTDQILKLAVLSGGSKGGGGGLKVLGVMAPEGGKLKLYKKYSKNDLSQISLNSIEDVFLFTEEEVKMALEAPASIFARKAEAEAEAEAEVMSEHNLIQKLDAEPEQKGNSTHLSSQAFSEVHNPISPGARAAVNKAHEMDAGEWQPSENPQNLFRDEDLRKSCENITGALEKPLDGGLVLLAVPFETDAPFSLMPIFCFGESMYIGGKNYLVFCIKDGSLYL